MSRDSASAALREAFWRAAILVGALWVVPAAPAGAQTTIPGEPANPDVVVNESVIDALGPPQTVPGVLRSDDAGAAESPALRPVTLHPPRAHGTAEAHTPAPQHTATASTATQKSHHTAKAKPERTARGTTELAAAKPPRPSKQTAAKAAPSQPLRRAALAKTAPPQAAFAPPAAPAPPQAASNPPAASAAPAPDPPSGPIPSIVRRYGPRVGQTALVAPPPSSSAPTPAPSSAPAPTEAAAPPAPSAAPSPSSAAAAPSPAPAPPSPPPAASTPAPATQVASTVPTPGAAQPAPAPGPAANLAAISPQSGLPTQVTFAPNVTDMPDQAKPALDTVIKAMKADEKMRVQVVAYASGPADQASQARRVSLQRAVNVRAYLIGQGVNNMRIEVRALGNRTDVGGPPDRVDVVATDR
jgi:outer membrane protein OmpA-like peptidoglycan-associated protein